MLFKNNQYHYGMPTIILHWLIAVMTFALFGLGLWMTDLGYYDDWYTKAPTLHEGGGVIFFVLLVVRILWRLMNRMPQALNNHKPWEKKAAYLAHNILNLLLIMITLSGYLIVTAKGDALLVFNFFTIPASLSGFSNQADISGDIHYFAAWVLIVFSIAHALAALKHHFIDKDETLKRMFNK